MLQNQIGIIEEKKKYLQSVHKQADVLIHGIHSPSEGEV